MSIKDKYILHVVGFTLIIVAIAIVPFSAICYLLLSCLGKFGAAILALPLWLKLVAIVAYLSGGAQISPLVLMGILHNWHNEKRKEKLFNSPRLGLIMRYLGMAMVSMLIPILVLMILLARAWDSIRGSQKTKRPSQ
ncbi:MAG: hypothetical protein KGI60_04810 [Patescibacteria group bacterium]|nr:hypothetical protein [Patescibacteria group bacterium]